MLFQIKDYYYCLLYKKEIQKYRIQQFKMKLFIILSILLAYCETRTQIRGDKMVSVSPEQDVLSIFLGDDCSLLRNDISQFPQYVTCNEYRENRIIMRSLCPEWSKGLNQSKCCQGEPFTYEIEMFGLKQKYAGCVSRISCFPEDTIVISKEKGNITMAELRLGDQILSYSKERGQHYSKVIAWLHKIVDKQQTYLKLTDSNGSHFHVSPLHSLALANGTYEFARNVHKQRLFNTNLTVDKIQGQVKRGVYAPYTQAANYFVVKSSGAKTLAHCNSNMIDPERFDWFIRLTFTTFPQTKEKTHPIMKLAESQILRKLFIALGITVIN